MEKEKEDRPLLVVCCRAGDNTSKLELENGNESKNHLSEYLSGGPEGFQGKTTLGRSIQKCRVPRGCS